MHISKRAHPLGWWLDIEPKKCLHASVVHFSSSSTGFTSGSHKRSHSLGDKEIGRSPPSPAPEQPFRDRSNTLSEKPALPVIRDKYKDLTGEVEVIKVLLISGFQHSTQNCSRLRHMNLCFLLCFALVFIRDNSVLCCCRRASATRTSGKGVWKMLWRLVFVYFLCLTQSYGKTWFWEPLYKWGTIIKINKWDHAPSGMIYCRYCGNPFRFRFTFCPQNPPHSTSVE